MSQLYRFVQIIVLLAVGSGMLSATAAPAPDVKVLKYQLKPGETYTYAVTIVADRADTTETFKGNIQLTVKSADDKAIHMTHAGSLHKTVQTKVVGGGPRVTPRGPTPIIRSREISIDQYGKVLTSSGTTPLSYLLGSIPQLVIEPLSPDGKDRWELETDVNIREIESLIPGARLGPKIEKNSAANKIRKFEIIDRKDVVVKIKKTYELKSALLAENNMPHLQLEGTGELAFDSKAGVLKSCDYKAMLTINEKNASVRIPLTITYRLLSAEETAALKKEAEERIAKLKDDQKKAAEPKPLSDAEITTALTELDSKNHFVFRAAADRLAKATPDQARREEVAAKLEGLLKERDGNVRTAGAKALKSWGTAKNVPTLITMLKDENAFAKGAAFEALGGIKDPKGAEAVAALLPDFFARKPAIDSLRAMGAVAEKPVLGLLQNQDAKVRTEACKLLADIGTKDSLTQLKALLTDSSVLVAKEAEKAISAIELRPTVRN